MGAVFAPTWFFLMRIPFETGLQTEIQSKEFLGKGRKRHINVFNINFLAPPPQSPPYWAPRKKFMCLILWERTQKKGPT